MSALETTNPVEHIAGTVASLWTDLNNQRSNWLKRVSEVRDYVTSPSTSFTEVGSKLPWKNKTVIPVLTQIADNLQSYYMAALMPTEDWFRWEGRDIESQKKAELIEEYMRTKVKMSGFRDQLTELVRDWVIYGNTFAGVTYVTESTTDALTNEEIINYQGPRLQRISPIDCVIDVKAKNFDESPLIIRRQVPLTSILTDDSYDDEGKEKVKHVRGNKDNKDFIQNYKDHGVSIDGFSSFNDYLSSQYVEVMEYWGDLYDAESGEVLKNRVITIVDRSIVMSNTSNPSWDGKKPFIHVGWRVLPDNLYGQGPLDHLIGMQYRIDHLENLKADAFDMIIHPMMKIVGDSVEDFEYGPGQRVYVGTDGDVEFIRPDTSVLLANNEVAIYRNFMEMAAGSPRESAGFRTPGEKTAFEVNVLQQGADRMFQDKLNHFEENGIQRILGLFFELMMRNFDVLDIARTFNDDTGALEIATFTKEDVVANGVFRPMGAKHFAARNKRVQEMQNLQMIAANPAIAPHFSGLNAGKMFEEELGFEKWNVIEENIGVREQVTTAVYGQQMQAALTSEQPMAEG